MGVKDTIIKDLSSARGSCQRNVRGFRRSDASVRDVASLTRNSSARGFRRSDTSVPVLRAEEAAEREFSTRSNFDSSSASLSLGDGLFESIPLSNEHSDLNKSMESNDLFMYSGAVVKGASSAASFAEGHLEEKVHLQTLYVNVNAV